MEWINKEGRRGQVYIVGMAAWALLWAPQQVLAEEADTETHVQVSRSAAVPICKSRMHPCLLP